MSPNLFDDDLDSSLYKAYSGDAVYLYSTLDDPGQNGDTSNPVISPNSKRRRSETPNSTDPHDPLAVVSRPFSPSEYMDEELIDQSLDEGEDGDDSDSDSILLDDIDDYNYHPLVPIIFPRRRFRGARNVRTVKDGE